MTLENVQFFSRWRKNSNAWTVKNSFNLNKDSLWYIILIFFNVETEKYQSNFLYDCFVRWSNKCITKVLNKAIYLYSSDIINLKFVLFRNPDINFSHLLISWWSKCLLLSNKIQNAYYNKNTKTISFYDGVTKTGTKIPGLTDETAYPHNQLHRTKYRLKTRKSKRAATCANWPEDSTNLTSYNLMSRRVVPEDQVTEDQCIDYWNLSFHSSSKR